MRGTRTYKGQVRGEARGLAVRPAASRLRHCPPVALAAWAALKAVEDCTARGQGRRTCSLTLCVTPHPLLLLRMAVTSKSSQARPQRLSPLRSCCLSVDPMLSSLWCQSYASWELLQSWDSFLQGEETRLRERPS